MKHRLLALCLVCLPIGGLALSTDSAPPIQDERIDQLEQELRDVSARLEKTIRALHLQAAGARTLARRLDVSEQQGFTYGINPRSREVLLDGFRDFLGRLQHGLPGATPPSTAVPTARIN